MAKTIKELSGEVAGLKCEIHYQSQRLDWFRDQIDRPSVTLVRRGWRWEWTLKGGGTYRIGNTNYSDGNAFTIRGAKRAAERKVKRDERNRRKLSVSIQGSV